MAASLLSLLSASGVLGMLALLGALVWILMDIRDPLRPRVFLFIAAIPIYGFVCVRLLQAENALLPMKFDFLLYHIDEALGFSALSIARGLHTGPVIPLLSEVYRSILIAMAVGYGAALKSRIAPSLLLAYTAEMVVGPFLYAILPACGPYYAFPGFPWSEFTSAISTVRLDGAPNAVPSLHMSTAILLVIFARTWRGRLLGGLYAMATAIATLTTGEHYVIDLIIGLPFACFAAAVAHRRLRAAAGYLGVVVAWMIALRMAGPAMAAHPHFLQLLAFVTASIAAFGTAGFWKERSGDGSPAPANGRAGELCARL